MGKQFLKVSLALFAVLLPIGETLAQTAPPDKKINPKLLKMSETEKVQARKEFHSRYPLLSKQKILNQRRSVLPNANMPVFAAPANVKKVASPLLARSNTVIWTNLAAKAGWTSSNHDPYGYYSFSPTSPINFTQLYETPVGGVRVMVCNIRMVISMDLILTCLIILQ